MRIILASKSPRRKELLAKVVKDFEVIPALSPEETTTTDPVGCVKELAFHKAMEVYSQNRDALVIGCDTVVDCNGKILGKPHSSEEAMQMLCALNGKTHFVHTGVFVVYGRQMWLFCESTAVTFRNVSRNELEKYVQSGAPMDKAGAYGIQECGFVESYEGSYDNVVGLPTERLAEILEKLDKG